ncbi:insulinase family protein [Pseudomonas sp. NEEL19]|uniref:M16 family metallopeptidase n=1 Tax=Pseudomonas sp. NEEL19 TaxID=2867409 RepID=UPI002368C4BD|nr:pitrilysin family protein [Pseudomonas sp. NEEL19]WDM59129.1 insulinase family protein [Pseudomonas sp. NEEL19]
MIQVPSPAPLPLTCNGPADDTALAAMANLHSAQGIDLGHIPDLQAHPEHWRTAEGTRVSFLARHDRPMFDLALRFRAGSVLDGAHPGLAALVLYSLDQGTGQLDATRFAEDMAGFGAILGRRISDDSALVTLRALSLPALRDSAMQLLTEMLASPALRAGDVAKIGERLVFSQARYGNHPLLRITKAATAHIFSGHPYAATLTAQTIASIGDDQIRAFHQQAYSANNLDIGLVGNLTREEARQLVDDLVRALPQGWAAQRTPSVPDYQALDLNLAAASSTTQATLTLATNVSAQDPVFPALYLLNAILGSSYESRLTQELRTLRNLTYAISCDLRPLDAASQLQIHWDIAPHYRDASGALVSAILACLREHGPSQAECDMAVNQIAGKLHDSLADRARMAQALATYSHQGLAPDHLGTFLGKLSALTPANLREAAQVWLQAPQVFVTSGPVTEQLPLPKPTALDQ